MRLLELLQTIEYSCINRTPEIEVTEVVYDSRKVCYGCLFICIEGANFDGHSAIEQAVANGAAAILVYKDVDLQVCKNATIIKVKDTRYAMAHIAAAYYQFPAKQLKIIGITGTKGKTTTTYLIKNILEQAGCKVGLIGTIETLTGKRTIPSHNTTPESFLIQEYFREMVEAGCEYVVMEVSSQGLMLHRTQGFIFDVGIFTNLEPDHIGPNEHANFEEYAACKSMLFRQCKMGFVNIDDEHCDKIIANHTCEIMTMGFSKNADYRADQVHLFREQSNLCTEFELTGRDSMHVLLHSPGRFSVYNALAAIAVCNYYGIHNEEIARALLHSHVKGRIEMIPVSKEYSLMIDYAHNAMALESLLTTLKEYKPKRLVCLFGCGGNRSKLRRYEMGEISGKLADITIITSDNPRFEDPKDIINDIVTGISKTSGTYVLVEDRKEAIAYAIHHAKPGDIIVLAGKGHEDYQEIKGVCHPMDERILIKEILREDGIQAE